MDPMTHLALLRGINVGGKHRVPMEDLRASFENAGMADVSTYINTGNVLFTAPDGSSASELAAQLEVRLSEDFGFPIPVLVVTGSDLAAVTAAIPSGWANDDTQKSDVIFLFPELHGPEALSRFPVKPGIDEVIYESGAVIWRVARKDQPRTGLVTVVGTSLYRRCTIRNVNTVRKLAALAASR